MTWLKEFLKPNRWKMGMFLSISILIMADRLLFQGSFMLWYLIKPMGTILYYGYLILGPIIYFVWFIYFYLLSCFMYFIFSKIKNLIIK